MELGWLPELTEWAARLREIGQSADVWNDAVRLSRYRLNATQTNALDRTVRELVAKPPKASLAAAPVRLAMLGSCTTMHLHSAIRVAGMRRGLWIDIHEPDYGQYWQALSEPAALQAFSPTAILLTFDAHHLAAGVDAGMTWDEVEVVLDASVERIGECWRLATACGCPVIQSIPLPVHPALMGSNESRLPGSRQTFIRRLSSRLRQLAKTETVDLLSLDTRAAIDGVASWHDRDLWFHAKQEVAPRAAPFYGELLTRVLGAQLGISAKCLVLDLDNTIWGGVVGDDGVEGIELGQGSAEGEAFLAVQGYARDLSRRGVILAVCSKNDEKNAFEPFDTHPEMVLRRADIASFVADWNDKAANLRKIAAELNIGLDALVFLDDNPFERDLVRRELPMVAVPEISDDPATYPRILEDAGYFEATRVTGEDRQRTSLYRRNADRARLRETTDLSGYLSSLASRLTWRPFDRMGLTRIVQLTNKTNQFNLTTRRYSETEVIALMDDPHSLGLQLRLVDRFGDNGVIAVVVGRLEPPDTMLIETWLMSCRVLGRGVETATLELIANQASQLGARRLVGEYRPTAKNGMVSDHYLKMGFAPMDASAEATDEPRRYILELPQRRVNPAAPITIEREVIA